MMTNKPERAFLLLLVLLGALIGWGSFWTFAEAPLAAIAKLPEKPTTVLFVGDIMLDRDVAVTARNEGPNVLFAGVSQLFGSTTYTVANLEGGITDNMSIAERDSSKLAFTFAPSLAADVLPPLKLSAVSLANNHAYDFGIDGYHQTRANLNALGIPSFGSPYNIRDLSTVLGLGDRTICLVGYHSLFDASTTTVVQEIARLRPGCWRVVVFAHWGVEYTHTPTSAQTDEAHSFIDAGADLVIGSHPHVVQSVETYRGKAIFYSLGNFMFDQNFSWDVEHGLAVVVSFYPAKTTFSLIPTSIVEQHAEVANGVDKQRVLDFVGGLDSITLP